MPLFACGRAKKLQSRWRVCQWPYSACAASASHLSFEFTALLESWPPARLRLSPSIRIQMRHEGGSGCGGSGSKPSRGQASPTGFGDTPAATAVLPQSRSSWTAAGLAGCLVFGWADTAGDAERTRRCCSARWAASTAAREDAIPRFTDCPSENEARELVLNYITSKSLTTKMTNDEN